MTEPTAAPKPLHVLLAELEAIENNFHGLADPQLAMAEKTRAILSETVRKLHEHCEALSALSSQAAALESRLVVIEAHPALSIPPLESAAAAPKEGDNKGDPEAPKAPAAAEAK